MIKILIYLCLNLLIYHCKNYVSEIHYNNHESTPVNSEQSALVIWFLGILFVVWHSCYVFSYHSSFLTKMLYSSIYVSDGTLG